MPGARGYGSICRALVVSNNIELVSHYETVLGETEFQLESQHKISVTQTHKTSAIQIR